MWVCRCGEIFTRIENTSSDTQKLGWVISLAFGSSYHIAKTWNIEFRVLTVFASVLITFLSIGFWAFLMKHFFPTPSRSNVYVLSSAPPSLISLSHMVNRVLLTLSWYESLSWNYSNIYWTPRTSFICSKRSEIREETGDYFLPNHRETRNFMNLFEMKTLCEF